MPDHTADISRAFSRDTLRHARAREISKTFAHLLAGVDGHQLLSVRRALAVGGGGGGGGGIGDGSMISRPPPVDRLRVPRRDASTKDHQQAAGD